MASGFMYFTAVIDLCGQYVVHCSVSNSMEAEWCAEFIQDTFQMNGTPEILTTDQGAQFRSELFTATVLLSDVKLSIDGEVRVTDKASIEKSWRSIKYEKDYIYPPTDVVDLYHKVEEDLYYYNYERRHSSIDIEVSVT